METSGHRMISRREWLGMSLAAGTTLAFTPSLLAALQRSSGKLIQRAIPSTGEMLPVISFGPRPTGVPGPGDIKPEATDVPAAKEVLRTFLDNGGKVVDVLHGGPLGEQAARTAAVELGIQDKFFWTTPLAIPGPPQKADAAAVTKAMEEKFAKFNVSKIDLVMVAAGASPTYFTVLTEMKKQGRVRYIGVHDLATPPYPPDEAFGRIESAMRNEPIDFVATDYAAGWRGVEEKILPLAQERKIGFMAYFPFDRNRIFRRASATPLPEWAAEFDAKTWSQFFLKYVVSHPAVTVVRTGTTKAAHMLENMGGGIGRLPDEAMRKRMAQFVDALPPTPPPGQPKQPKPQAPKEPAVVLTAAVLDRYVGEYKAPAGLTLTFRRDGTTLFVKPSTQPEGPLVAHSETRFSDPRGPSMEFQLDGQGKVTGLVLELAGGQRVTAKRQ